MSKTAEDLITEAAAILGKFVAGEPLGETEHDTIDRAIDDVLAEIQGIIYIGDRDEIEDKYFQTIARLVALHAAAKFSNSPADYATIIQHENRLRYLVGSDPSYQPLKVDYF